MYDKDNSKKGFVVDQNTERLFQAADILKGEALRDQFLIAGQRVKATQEDLLVAVATLAGGMMANPPQGYSPETWLKAWDQIMRAAYVTEIQERKRKV